MTGRSGTYGLVEVAGSWFGLSVEHLVEVVPAPADYAPVLGAHVSCLGTFDLRGDVVAVCDLGAVLGGRPSTGLPVVAVVEAGGRRFALAVDRVGEVASLADAEMQPIDAGAAYAGCATSVCRLDDRTVTVVDLDALGALDAVVTTDRRTRDDVPGPDAARTAPAATASELLVRCGSHRFALDSNFVVAVAPAVTVTESVLTGGPTLGHTPYMGNDVPVVDLLALTGLGTLDRITDGLVVKYPDGHVVFAVSEVVGLERVPLESMRPLPALGLADPARFSAVFELADGGLHLVLDHEALAADPAMATLGRLNVASRVGQDDTLTPLDDASVTIGRSAAHAVRYLRYVVGDGDDAIEFATPVEQIVGVGPVPADAVYVDGADGVLGFFESGGRTVPLVCLARQLGLESGGSPALAAFVDVDGRRIALLVARFDVIAVPSWVEATTSARWRSLTFPGSSGLVAELDLQALGRGLLTAFGPTR